MPFDPLNSGRQDVDIRTPRRGAMAPHDHHAEEPVPSTAHDLFSKVAKANAQAEKQYRSQRERIKGLFKRRRVRIRPKPVKSDMPAENRRKRRPRRPHSVQHSVDIRKPSLRRGGTKSSE